MAEARKKNYVFKISDIGNTVNNNKKIKELSFFEKVYHVARTVPFGRVTTYGAIAEYIGTKGSSRMVGWAMNKSHSQSIAVPAHRVVNRIGLLTGKHHFGGKSIMQELLENEGIEVADNQIVNFEKVFWNPKAKLNK